jgi:hypothetical protein
MHSRLDPPERIVVQHFHVWTLYPKIYLARTRRTLPPDPAPHATSNHATTSPQPRPLMQSACAMGHASSCLCVGVSCRAGGRKRSRTFPPRLTPGAKPSPRSRCFAPLSNALGALFRHRVTTSGERSTARSSPTTSVLLTPVCFRSLAFGMNGTTSRAASPCSHD